MNKTSSIVTGGVTITAASLIPAVTWGLKGFTDPIPESVPYLIAALIVTGIHLASNYINHWLDNKSQPTDKAAS